MFQVFATPSIDLSAAHNLITDTKLPKNVLPNHYTLELKPNFEDNSFSGTVKINISFIEESKEIFLHTYSELEIQESTVKVRQISSIRYLRV